MGTDGIGNSKSIFYKTTTTTARNRNKKRVEAEQRYHLFFIIPLFFIIINTLDGLFAGQREWPSSYDWKLLSSLFRLIKNSKWYNQIPEFACTLVLLYNRHYVLCFLMLKIMLVYHTLVLFVVTIYYVSSLNIYQIRNIYSSFIANLYCSNTISCFKCLL